MGSFKIDDANGVILLDENYKHDYLMVEYIASPNPDEEYMIPLVFREALIEWLWWRDNKVQNRRRGAIGLNSSARHDYFEARRKARNKWKPLHLEEAYEWSQQMTRLGIKI